MDTPHFKIMQSILEVFQTILSKMHQNTPRYGRNVLCFIIAHAQAKLSALKYKQLISEYIELHPYRIRKNTAFSNR